MRPTEGKNFSMETEEALSVKTSGKGGLLSD